MLNCRTSGTNVNRKILERGILFAVYAGELYIAAVFQEVVTCSILRKADLRHYASCSLVFPNAPEFNNHIVSVR